MSKQTLTEKILAKAAGKAELQSGEIAWVNVDRLLTHDVCGPGTISLFKKHFGKNAKVFDPEKVIIIPDHYIFTQDKKAQRNLEILNEFAKEQELPYYYPAFTDQYKGVCHVALAEEGHNLPGSVLFGTDSHTCTSGAFGLFSTGIGNTDAAFIMGTGKLWVKVPVTRRFELNGEIPPYLMAKDLILKVIGDIGVDGGTYMALEWGGEAIASMNIEERMTLCNMAIECGGKNGIVEADSKTEEFLKGKAKGDFEFFKPDQNANYFSQMTYDASKLAPQVAKPHSPDNVCDAFDLRQTNLTRAYIGSCTGGKLEDFKAAAKILEGEKVKIDTFIVPATRKVEQDLKKETYKGKTLHQIFEDSGCRFGNPGCGACLGGPEDTFARANGKEVVISTTNRNFPGRMGSPLAEIYLASPLTVAASSLTGKITDPREFFVR